MKRIYTSGTLNSNGTESRLTVIQDQQNTRLIVREEIPQRPANHEAGFIKSDVTVSNDVYKQHEFAVLLNTQLVHSEN